jgi:AcrR family transcriptional regulator
MPTKRNTETVASGRAPRLSAERVIDGAVELADRIGVDRLTIRKLADALDVKPMTIYHHVANKEAIIDGMVERVFTEIELPPTDRPWREAILVRCRSMRRVLARHPWAAPLMENRPAPGPATLGHHDAVVGCFRRAGFSLELVGHAYAIVDAFLYGFALQEASLPATAGDDMADLAGTIMEQMPADRYPFLTEFTVGRVLQPGYDFGEEFDIGIDVILDGLARAADDERAP